MAIALDPRMNPARTLALSLALVTFVLGTLVPPAAARVKPPAPESVRDHEVVETVTDSVGPGGTRLVSFRAFGREFDLVLTENPLFTSDAEDVWVRGHGAANGHRRARPEPRVFKGEIAGESESWVRVRLRGGILDGVVRSGGELYFVESAARFFRSNVERGMVIYRLSDTVSELGPGSCALESPAVEQAMAASEDADSTTPPLLLPEIQSLTATTFKQIDLALVADYEYYVEHGAASASDMQSIANQVDGILQSELGLSLRIVRTVVHTTSADPFTSTTDAVTLLNELTNYKSAPSSPIYDADLAQLFTGRDLEGSTLGIAWVASLCTGAWGTSVAQDFTSTAKSLTILSAHELGHNLAAHHDAQTGSVCASMPFGYIMFPSISTELNLQFSTCSKSSIEAHVSKAACLADVSSSAPTPSPTPAPVPTCSFQMSPSSVSLGAGSVSGSVSVSTTSACAWTASSSASWLTVTSGASRVGSGVVGYAVGPNPGPLSRSATLTIAGQAFTVTQAAPSTAAIRVIAPNGGESWPIGAMRTITWSSSGLAGYVKIDVSRDGGTTWSILASSTPNDGSHVWKVTAPATTRARFRVSSVTNPTIRDGSDGNVRLGGGTITLTAPNGGEWWARGSTQQVRWSSTNLAGNVAIEVTTDGVSWSSIASSTPNDGTHSWALYSPRSTRARVRIRSLSETVTDVSDAVFTIR